MQLYFCIDLELLIWNLINSAWLLLPQAGPHGLVVFLHSWLVCSPAWVTHRMSCGCPGPWVCEAVPPYLALWRHWCWIVLVWALSGMGPVCHLHLTPDIASSDAVHLHHCRGCSCKWLVDSGLGPNLAKSRWSLEPCYHWTRMKS